MTPTPPKSRMDDQQNWGFIIPLAPLDSWLPESARWPDGHQPTDEELAQRMAGVRIAYKRALRRRHGARLWARKTGKPLPPLDEPLIPLATDYPFYHTGKLSEDSLREKAIETLGRNKKHAWKLI